MQEHGTIHKKGTAFIWKWGAISGITLGVIQIILSQFSLGLLKTFPVWLIGFFLIGLFAARHTGRAETGVLVGLVTGLIGGLIVALFGIIQLVGNDPLIVQALNQAARVAQQHGQNLSLGELRTIAIIGGLIVTVGIELGLGAGIGALGGLLGRHQTTRSS